MADKATQKRKAQNQGVKGGTLRKGVKGNYMRRYNEKTGRWDIVSSTKKTAKKFMKEKSEAMTKRAAKSDAATKKSSRSATSATVSSAVKSGNAAGASKKISARKNWWEQGGGGLAGPNSPFSRTPKPTRPKKDPLSTSPMTWGSKRGSR
jgi:hypothetical protein